MKSWCQALGLALVFGALHVSAAELPGRYYQMLSSGMAQVGERLAAERGADLKTLEARPGWRHFPSAVLVAAVLYAKQHPANPHYRDAKMREAAFAIGDLLVAEQRKKVYATRLDHHRDTYMWLEAYRLLESELGEARRAQWRAALFENLTPLAEDVARRADRPWYNSPFIVTSPNHLSLWSSTVYLAGRVFHNREWENLGFRVMHRFADEEQAPDGYWGEHSRSGPTTGYDYLTATAVALFWEHSKDKAALEALRRSTTFHKYFTYPDGSPVETINDRNRYWGEPMWGQFGFSNFPDGRRYAEFLTAASRTDRISLEALGRNAQNALYYHEGPLEPIPQDMNAYVHRMSVPAGIRKNGPWVVCLSGLIGTSTLNQYYLDRQSALSIFHQKFGPIVTGANSKRQPELATFSEKIRDQVYHLPMSSRLDMGEGRDRLALAYNSFYSVLDVPAPAARGLEFTFNIVPTGRASEATLTLQLCLKPGRQLETASGKTITLGEQPVELGPEDIGAWIRHNGWTLKTDARARLVWPIRPYSPYANGPEKGLEHAVGALSVPLERGPQSISFTLEAN